MGIIALPTKFAFTSVNRFGLVRRTNVLRSRYTGQGQRVVYPYAVWEFDGDLVEYDGPEAAAIRAFFALLEGQKNSFRLPIPGYTRPSTIYGNNVVASPTYGNPLTNAAALVRASAISIRDFNSGLANNLAAFDAGDFITIQDELKIITAPVAFNATSDAVINFKPALRKAVANNVQIIVKNPIVLMVAADDDVATWGLKAPFRHQLKLSAIEAMDIP